MASLNRFISRLGEWGLPFFNILKHQEKFKDFLSKPPVLTDPRKKE
jgi:hypothetical protein